MVLSSIQFCTPNVNVISGKYIVNTPCIYKNILSHGISRKHLQVLPRNVFTT